MIGLFKRENLLHVLMFVGIILPLLVVEYFSYRRFEQELTKGVMRERESIASLSASVLKERFDRVKDVAISFATRVKFRELIKQAKWNQAMTILQEVPRDFPFIERVFLADTLGTLMSDYPALGNVRGKNFSYRDWYKGVARRWSPYMSEVYKRAAPPQLNVVALSTPIDEAGSKKIIGILVVQIPLNILLEWIKEIEVGSSGFIYVTDHTGKVAAHPSHEPQADVLDYSMFPVVQRVLKGKSGVELIQNGDSEYLTAYAPVQAYGWGVIAEEPVESAFATQQRSLQIILFIYGGIFLLALFFAFVIIRIMAENRRARLEILQLNKDLEKRAIQLEDVNKELEAFSYSVSHDLRAPLRHIDGFVQMLEKRSAPNLDEASKEYLATISESATEMGKLIDDLLVFSRMGKIELRKTTVSMEEIVKGVIERSGADREGRNIEWKISSLPEVEADPSMIKLVFQNLIGNALKYTRTRDKAVIEVRSENANDEVIVWVADNGVGFDMKYAHKLFGVFQRLHGSEGFEGTGIGLANVRRIIQRHGGRTWAEGEVEQGARFYFTLARPQKEST